MDALLSEPGEPEPSRMVNPTNEKPANGGLLGGMIVER